LGLPFDAQLTARAQSLLAEQGYRNVLLISANGRHGWSAGAPYDRLIAWCSVTAVPPAWRDQTLPGAILVLPMRHAEQHWISQYHRSDGDTLVEGERQTGGFVPLTSAPFRPWERAAR
jgi:protein-L-isoaspartate(D-aspartate) O-methyltransferase